MNIVKYDPFRTLRSLQNEFNSLLDFPSTWNEGMTNSSWTPNVDVRDTGSEIVVEAEVAGYTPEQIDVTLENNVLSIVGEKRQQAEEKSESYFLKERMNTKFSRSFRLPHTVDSENVKAEYENGVLRIALAKQEKTLAKKIEVKALSEPTKTMKAGA